MSELISMFSYHFMQRALIVGVLVSLCAALLGVSLVLKCYSMIGDGLSHVGFGALAIASAFNLAPLGCGSAGSGCGSSTSAAFKAECGGKR